MNECRKARQSIKRSIDELQDALSKLGIIKIRIFSLSHCSYSVPRVCTIHDRACQGYFAGGVDTFIGMTNCMRSTLDHGNKAHLWERAVSARCSGVAKIIGVGFFIRHFQQRRSLAHAEWDQDLPSYMLYAYFAKLTNVPYKRYVEIGEGTHTIIMEKNRLQLFDSVQYFLDERILPE